MYLVRLTFISLATLSPRLLQPQGHRGAEGTPRHGRGEETNSGGSPPRPRPALRPVAASPRTALPAAVLWAGVT